MKAIVRQGVSDQVQPLDGWRAGEERRRLPRDELRNVELPEGKSGPRHEPDRQPALLGIQAQMEQRNVAVGNAIRNATAAAISKGQKIDPVTVQKIVADYDEQHHIKDVVTGQDLTQSYALPEFQNTNPTNTSMAGAHTQNIKSMEKTIGGVTYVQRDGNWYPK
jgi:hypothetical protein